MAGPPTSTPTAVTDFLADLALVHWTTAQRCEAGSGSWPPTAPPAGSTCPPHPSPRFMPVGTGALLTVVDVSDEMDETRRAHELTRVLEATPDPVAVLDPSGRIRGVGQRRPAAPRRRNDLPDRRTGPHAGPAWTVGPRPGTPPRRCPPSARRERGAASSDSWATAAPQRAHLGRTGDPP